MPDEKKETMRVDGLGMSGYKDIKMSFPSNAHTKREEKEQPKKLEKVVTGKVLKRKKSFSKRLAETFIGEDVNSVFGYILHDVLIPAAKSTISDMVQGGIEMMLFGERKGSRTRRENGRSYVSYNSYSNPSYGRRDDRRDISHRSRARHDFGELSFTTRGEAETVLSDLVDLTIDYGQATVANLYDLCGITENFTDSKYGWTDLSSASVSRDRDGYVLNLPRPILLD